MAGNAELLNDGTVRYVADAQFIGQDVFGYLLADDKGGVAAGQIFVDVFQNSLPVAMIDHATTGVDRSTVVDVLANDSDPDGDIIFVASAGPPGSGTAQVIQNGILYDPNETFEGVDTFFYVLEDAKGEQVTGEVQVTVL